MKKNSLSRLVKSFTYAINGIVNTYKEEQNFIVHTICAAFVIIFGILCDIGISNFIVIIILIGFVHVCELINTALENLCDEVTSEKTEYIRKCKDAAAGAVLVSAFTAVIVGLLIFVPKIIALIGG